MDGKISRSAPSAVYCEPWSLFFGGILVLGHAGPLLAPPGKRRLRPDLRHSAGTDELYQNDPHGREVNVSWWGCCTIPSVISDGPHQKKSCARYDSVHCTSVSYFSNAIIVIVVLMSQRMSLCEGLVTHWTVAFAATHQIFSSRLTG